MADRGKLDQLLARWDDALLGALDRVEEGAVVVREGLPPDEPVADEPTVVDQTKQQPFGAEQQALRPCAGGLSARVDVAQVQPERAARLQYARDLSAHRAQTGHVSIDVCFEPELARFAGVVA